MSWLILLVIVIIIIIIIWVIKKRKGKIYVKSHIDNKQYLVQAMENKIEATRLLSIIRQRIFLLKDYFLNNMDHYPEFLPYIRQFCDRVDNITLTENSPNGDHTSYTINKGQEIALCLRSKHGYALHDLNLIMYVVLHELSHVACPEIDHTELFKKIFIFFQQIAIKIGIYRQVNYQEDPHEYCGLTITENLLSNQ